MHVPRVAGLLVLALALAGCGAAENATLSVGGSGGGGAGAPNTVVVSGPSLGPPLTQLQRRTTGAVTLRTFTTPPFESGGCGGSGECVPDWCQPAQSLVIELSTPAMVAVLDSDVLGLGSGSSLSILGTSGGGPYAGGISMPVSSSPNGYASTLTVAPGLGPLPYAGPGPDQPTVAGVAEGDPVQVVAVHVASTVAKVTMRTAHGEDSTAPVRGLAVLAAPGSASSGELTASDSHGHTVATVSLPTTPTQSTAACAPKPPALPSAGVQPADPATATAAIRKAYMTAFTAVPGQRADVPGNVQDGQQILSAINQARENFPQAAATITVTTGQLVFTSPTTAAVFFTVTYQQGAPYGTQIGQAVLEGGKWLVTKDTYCGLLAFAGATCPAG